MPYPYLSIDFDGEPCRITAEAYDSLPPELQRDWTYSPEEEN